MKYQKTKLAPVTLAVPSKSTNSTLPTMLGSVLSGTMLPQQIVIHVEVNETTFPSSLLYQVNELTTLAARFGITCSVSYVPKVPIRKRRDLLLHNVGGMRFVWFLDDDCIVENDCLEILMRAICNQNNSSCAAVTGMKLDVNNHRNYPDFSTTIKPYDGASPFAHEWTALYEKQDDTTVVNAVSLDTGNVLIDPQLLFKNEIRFSNITPTNESIGGEDGELLIQCHQKGLEVKHSPFATAYHLNQQTQNFNAETPMRFEYLEQIKKGT